jgi:hypothetical protein
MVAGQESALAVRKLFALPIWRVPGNRFPGRFIGFGISRPAPGIRRADRGLIGVTGGRAGIG